MGGVYGDMLLAWTEQQRAIEVYEMEAKINGGWEKVTDPQTGEVIKTTVIGVFQNTRGGGLKDSNGNLVKVDGREFWTRLGNLEGKFFDWEEYVYRLVDVNNWSYEGGFYRYGVEKVVGNNGTESEDSTWNFGNNTFY